MAQKLEVPYQFTNDELLAIAQASEASANPFVSVFSSAQIGKIQASAEAEKQFTYTAPRCFHCGHLLIVPGEDCRGCGVTCREAMFPTRPRDTDHG